MFHYYLHRTSCQYNDDTFLISCFHACAMTCELFMPTICTHDMLAMIPSSMLHLRTTSLLDLTLWLLALSHHPCYTLTCFLGLMTYMFMPLTWYILFIVACLQLLHLSLLIVEIWTLYLWCMLAWLRLLYLVVLASYASILWNAPLSFLMMSMMHPLVGYFTARMIGFPLTSFVFPSVCHVLSCWRIHKAIPSWDNLVMWRHTRCATPTFARIS